MFFNAAHNRFARDSCKVVSAHKGALIITSNRTVDAWIKLFPNHVMANAALDRLVNIAFQIVTQGEAYRKKLRSHLKVELELEREIQ